MPNLNIRYFFTDNNALRIGLAYQYSSILREIKEVGGDGVGTVEKLNDLFCLTLDLKSILEKTKYHPILGVSCNLDWEKMKSMVPVLIL